MEFKWRFLLIITAGAVLVIAIPCATLFLVFGSIFGPPLRSNLRVTDSPDRQLCVTCYTEGTGVTSAEREVCKLHRRDRTYDGWWSKTLFDKLDGDVCGVKWIDNDSLDLSCSLATTGTMKLRMAGRNVNVTIHPCI